MSKILAVSPFLDGDVGNRLATALLDLKAVRAEGRYCHGEHGVHAG